MDKLTRFIIGLIETRIKARIMMDLFEKQSKVEKKALHVKIQIFKNIIEGVKKVQASELAKNAIIEPLRMQWSRYEDKYYKDLNTASSNLKKTQAFVDKREKRVAEEIVAKKALIDECMKQGRTAEGERLEEEMNQAINLLQSTKQED